MNAQTNVDLTNKYICIDVDEKSMHPSLLPSYIYIAFDCVYSIVRMDVSSLSMIFLDELWKMMINKRTSAQVKEMAKVIRGYGAGVCFATQDITDMVESQDGMALISNTAVKFVMYLEKREIETVSANLQLNQDDCSMISSFPRGRGLLISRNNKICIDVVPSKKEEEEFTTDPNKIRELKHRKELAKNVKED